MLDFCKKENLVRSLCKQITNLEEKLAHLDKPKLYVRKLAAIIDFLNRELMIGRILFLNQKYSEEADRDRESHKNDKRWVGDQIYQ